MKIAINCAFLQPKGGGIKEYIINLVSNMVSLEPNNDYVIYVLKEFSEFAKITFNCSSIRIKGIPFKTGSLYNKVIRSMFEHRFWVKEEQIEKWDLFHSPFFHCPKLKNTKTVITVHDLRFVRYPETYSFFRVHFLQWAVRRSIISSDKIISISNFTKSEIIKAYGVKEDKIIPILEAINANKFSIEKCDKLGLCELNNSRFILTVGHLEPRKNYDRLIMGLRKAKEQYNELKDIKLVIVGQKGCRFKKTLDLINNNIDVLYLDFVSHEILIWLYKNASLFVFPSIYEGFGFPPLEAAALGLPSAVSNVSSIPEVCKDFVEYFDPYDEENICEVISKCLLSDSLRENLKSRLSQFIESFSWEENARQTLKLYHQLVAN